MSSIEQLGLFSGLGTSEATPSSDVATTPANSDEPAAVNRVAVSECSSISKPLATERANSRRQGGTVASANAHAEERYLSVQDVARRYAVSIQTVWRHTKQNPAFPKPIKILNGSTRWRQSDILAFEVSRAEAGR
jgi:predicted DNA-binding transcriptional regulator AlpA